jgi:hypothetical protein
VSCGWISNAVDSINGSIKNVEDILSSAEESDPEFAEELKQIFNNGNCNL